MNESLTQNPYSPPETETLGAESTTSAEFASRGQRLAAAIIDSLVLMVVVVPLQISFGVYDAIGAGQEPSALTTYGIATVGLAVFLGINIPLWAKRSQSLGKIVLGIRIVDEHGAPANVKTILVKRTLPIWVASWIPVVGTFAAMVDSVAILGKDQLCLHDRIANTRVVRA